jgi:hypothetical protein
MCQAVLVIFFHKNNHLIFQVVVTSDGAEGGISTWTPACPRRGRRWQIIGQTIHYGQKIQMRICIHSKF